MTFRPGHTPRNSYPQGVCTNRLDYVTHFVNELEVVTVNVREVPGYRLEMLPFSGVKDSGMGRRRG